jgi:hypothetical protein
MAEIILIIFGIFLIRIFLNRNMPRVGGKIGALTAAEPPAVVPDGFSRVYARIVTVFIASSDGAANECVQQEGPEPRALNGAAFLHCNFVRIHQTLKVSPVIAAGVTKRLWEMTDVVEMIAAWEAAS